MFGREKVVRLRPTGDIDPYTGAPSGAATRMDLWTSEPPAPRTAAEDVRSDRTASIEGWTLLFPNGSDVQRSDRFEVRGVEFAVDGEPADWPGQDLMVQTIRVEG
jgi:hypothetical protein